MEIETEDKTIIKDTTGSGRDLMVINFNYIPDADPIVKGNKDWVLWGDNHCYPKYLVALADKSGLHNALIVGKANICYGDGFYIKNKDQITPEQLITLNSWMENINKKGETLNDILQKVVIDMSIF